MTHSYHALPTLFLPAHCPYMHPTVLPEVTHINDPASSVMVDFRCHTPPVIGRHQSLDEAKAEMQIYHLPLLLVLDSQQDAIAGLVVSEDILGEKPIKLSQEKRIPRSEMEVGMVMTPVEQLVAIDIEELVHAKVGHIIQTFRSIKQSTLAVIQYIGGDKMLLRGLFSASLISRQLDKDITLLLSEAQSIAELQHDLHH